MVFSLFLLKADMFLVNVRNDYDVQQFPVGDPMEELLETLSVERKKPSEYFDSVNTSLPVFRGTNRVA